MWYMYTYMRACTRLYIVYMWMMDDSMNLPIFKMRLLLISFILHSPFIYLELSAIHVHVCACVYTCISCTCAKCTWVITQRDCLFLKYECLRGFVCACVWKSMHSHRFKKAIKMHFPISLSQSSNIADMCVCVCVCV